MDSLTEQSRILKAAIIRAVRDRQPIQVTVEDLQYAKEYEDKHGPLQISAILEGRCFTLGIASRLPDNPEWPDEDKVEPYYQ